jgi:hypothetical protein
MYNQNGNLPSSINIFIRQPSNSDMAWDRYVTPFSYGLWLAVAITVCVIGICVAVTNYGHERKRNITFSEILFSIHASFCQQGESCGYYFMTSLFPHIRNPVS